MSDHAEQAAYIIGPHIDKSSVLALTTTPAGLDLSSASELGPRIGEGRFLTITADGDAAYYFMNNSNAGTPDPTATSGSNRCQLIPNGGSVTFIPRAGYHFIRARAATGTGFLRMYLSSKPPNQLQE